MNIIMVSSAEQSETTDTCKYGVFPIESLPCHLGYAPLMCSHGNRSILIAMSPMSSCQFCLGLILLGCEIVQNTSAICLAFWEIY